MNEWVSRWMDRWMTVLLSIAITPSHCYLGCCCHVIVNMTVVVKSIDAIFIAITLKMKSKNQKHLVGIIPDIPH